ncbi:hypothetical protein ILYODFUR_030265 [Ilyodon furcidens]|uniref:Uncharacterized protein n=1 Tax=Ilyodon furcidens TaxID=33524 RepID=A0ABV0SQD4_9TELE
MTEGTSQRDQAGRMGLVDGLPPLPAPIPGPVLEGSEDKLPPSLVPVPEEFVDKLSPLPVSVPEGCEDVPCLRRKSPRPHRRPQWFQPLCRRPADCRIGRGWLADRRTCRGRLADRRTCRGRPPGRPHELPAGSLCYVYVRSRVLATLSALPWIIKTHLT